MQFLLLTTYLRVVIFRRLKHNLSLVVDAPRCTLENRSVVIMTAESLPDSKAHINRVIAANVLVGNDSLLSNTVASNRNSLSTKLVVLRGTVLAEDGTRNGNEGHVRVGVLEVGAETASSVLPEKGSAVRIAAELEDGNGIVARNGSSRIQRGGVGRGAQRQGGDDGNDGELHFEQD